MTMTNTTGSSLDELQSRKGETKLAALRAALEEGERSAVAVGFSLDRVLTKLRNQPRS